MTCNDNHLTSAAAGPVLPVLATTDCERSLAALDVVYQHHPAGIRLPREAMAWPARMSRSSPVTSSGYRSRVASRSHRWAGVEYEASSRSSSEHRLRAAFELAGVSRATRRNQAPDKKATAPTPLRSMTLTTVNTPPASRGRQRVRAARASRIRPITVSSPPVRIHRRIRLVRATRVNLGTPYRLTGPADGLHTTRFRRCGHSLIAASCTSSAALRLLNGRPLCSLGARCARAGYSSQGRGASRCTAAHTLQGPDQAQPSAWRRDLASSSWMRRC
jgi:hypothetical protein